MLSSCDLAWSSDPKISTFKSCNFVGSQHTGLENSLPFALSLTVSEIMPFKFPKSCDLEGSCDPKSLFSKVLILRVVNPKGFEYSLSFSLSLTVSEITGD